MQRDDMIQTAEEVIGRDEPNDYTLRLSDLPARYQASAPPLAALLAHSSLTETARRFEQKDLEAIEAQAVFRRLAFRATLLLFVSTVAAALLSSTTAWAPPSWQPYAAYGLGACSLVAGLWAGFCLNLLERGRLLHRWMTARAAAETERLMYFTRAAGRAADNADPQLMLLSLELFRRLQLALQQHYYIARADRHESSLSRTNIIGAGAAVVLALGSGAGGIVAGAIDPSFLPLAALGIIGAALANVASRRESLNQDERNTERYRRTAETLSRIRERHSDVQQGVAAGHAETLTRYVAAVHEQLSLEHRQWIEDTNEISPALDELNAALESSADTPQDTPPAGT
jgi:hypothetical protein